MAVHRLASGLDDGGSLRTTLIDSLAPRVDAVFQSMWLDRESPITLVIVQHANKSLPTVTIQFDVRPREWPRDFGSKKD